jgi:hypothetical protein
VSLTLLRNHAGNTFPLMTGRHGGCFVHVN